MRDTSTVLRVFTLVALLAAAPLVGAVAPATAAGNQTATTTPTVSATASPTPTETPTPTPTADSGGDSSDDSGEQFSVAELSKDGTHYSNAPDSVRFGRERMYWVVYWPASSPFSDPGNDENWKYLSSGHTVGRNSVWIRSIIQERRAGSATVHVVAWQKGQQTVTRGNTTTTEPVAENVSHTTHNVNLQRGWLLEEIPLEQHDQPVRITMWVEGIDGARWTFKHHSVATTQSVNIDSEGDYLKELFTDFLWVVILGMPVVGLGTKSALDRAGRGPYGSYTPWVIALGFFGGIGVITLYQSLADLVVAAPMLIGVGVVALFGIIMLETYTSNVSKALFIQPRLEHAQSPTGEEAMDIIGFEAESHTTVRMPEGGVAIIKNGLLPFLARVFGTAAYLDTRQRMLTSIETADSKWDHVYLVDPGSEDVVEHTAEGWTLDFPTLDRATAPLYTGAAAVTGIVGFLAHAGIVNPLVGFGVLGVAALVWGATPTDGRALVTPAPPHFRPAYGTIASLIEGYSDAETIEEAKQQLDRERISKHQDVEAEIEQRDKSLVREMHDGDVPASIRNDRDDGHDDVVDKREDVAATDGGEDGDA